MLRDAILCWAEVSPFPATPGQRSHPSTDSIPSTLPSSNQQGLTGAHFLVGFFSSGFSRDITPGPPGRCEVVVSSGKKGQ